VVTGSYVTMAAYGGEPEHCSADLGKPKEISQAAMMYGEMNCWMANDKAAAAHVA